jgi:SAM-dependent methyltransferase
MHESAYRYVAGIVAGQRYSRVCEVGSRDVNGGIRDLVDAGTYIGIDLEAGPGVDVVADCRFWEPPWKASLVLALEVLEHAPDPREVVDACIGYLRPGGRLIVTCAGPGRAAHSGHDGGPVQEGEHYANIAPLDLERWLAEDLEAVRVRYNGIAKDVYATGIKR